MRGATIQNGKALYLRTIQRALNRMALIPQSKLVWRTRVAFIVLAMPMFCRAQVITTVAGVNNLGYAGDGGPAVSASLSNPEGLVLDSAGNLYFADKGNYAVREVNSGGTINTVAGVWRHHPADVAGGGDSQRSDVFDQYSGHGHD